MPLTNFPNGISSFGVPVLAGMPMPFTGAYLFLDPAHGSDGVKRKSNSIGRAFRTLPAAFDAAEAGKNDVIVLIGDGGTTATARLSETLEWSKAATHLIGIAAPVGISQRARISTANGQATNINPLVKVTAQGCAFVNLSVFQGVGQADTDEQLWQDDGQRNYYGNVHFGGMGHETGAARAGSWALKLYGGGERLFERCTVGVDTKTRSAANASLLLRKNAADVAATRDVFRDCLFPMITSAATPWFIDANESGCIDRFTLFERCKFLNAINSTATAVAAVVRHHASQGGTIVLDDCTAVGANDWTAADTDTVKVIGPVPNGDTSGMAVSADKT